MFNKSQQSAVDHIEGPCLVLAGAGSGKTRVITGRVENLINKGVKPESILAMTFTNKAAGEMGERIKETLGKDLSKGLLCTTFHSFCVRFLKEFIKKVDKGFTKDFSIYTYSEQLALIKKSMHNLGIGENFFDPKLVLWKISSLKTRGIDIAKMEILDPLSSVARRVVVEYARVMKLCNALDFDDLLNFTEKILKNNIEVRKKVSERYKFILVDEFQDTNNVQYRIVKHLASEHKNIFVVGDDDQSIYGFRGANFENILQFDRDWGNCKVVILDMNYRCSSTILDAANAVIGNNSERKAKDVNAFNNSGDKIEYFENDNEKDEATNIAMGIETLGRKNYGETAILIRANYQARALEEILRSKKIPYNLVGGIKFFERKEIMDILGYLKIIVNPSDEVSILRVINLPKRGIGNETIFKISNYAQEKGITFYEALKDYKSIKSIRSLLHDKLEKFLIFIENSREMFKYGNLLENTKEYVSKTGYINYLEEEFKEDDKKLKNKLNSIDELYNSISDYCEENPKAKLSSYLEKISLKQDSDDLSTKNQIKIMTVHSSKGLEFDNIFIAGLEEGTFPHERSLEENNIEEERRLFYVAITRARKKLYLSSVRVRKKMGEEVDMKRSRFLSEIPEQLFLVSPEKYQEVSLEYHKSAIAEMMKKISGKL
ncbi:MAG: ATP-dependent DNA helicase [Candidatus Cloacimonadota bacterium]|nr:MAG: ATP-dependent DNA helicase [Candidatus Cloacimonadota bacterium]PIE78018.1 MAG: ATP-dependent DNA helicase [Candidatus Delongbacteria bacterium]